MDKDINIEVSEIISLTNGNPESILPGLFASNSLKIPTDNNTPQLPRTDPDPSPHRCMPSRKKIKLNNYVHSSKIKYHGMQAQTLRLLIQGDKVIGFCQEHNLIAREVECYCGKQMKLQFHSSGDGCKWVCFRHRKLGRGKQTIRKGTFFANARITITDVLWIAYMWVHEYSQLSMQHESDVSNHTLIDWVKHFQDVCQAALEYKNEPLGGDYRSVEIYECNFKNGRSDKWCFFALEQYSTKSILIIVDDKTSQSIVEIFNKYFLPETVVVSHVWCAMTDLTVADFRYLTEEKLITFYDQVAKSEMKEYEVFRKTARRPPPGPNKMEYGPLFFERMYRKSLAYAHDAYLAFLKDISMIYTPCTKCVKSKSED